MRQRSTRRLRGVRPLGRPLRARARGAAAPSISRSCPTDWRAGVARLPTLREARDCPCRFRRVLAAAGATAGRSRRRRRDKCSARRRLSAEMRSPARTQAAQRRATRSRGRSRGRASARSPIPARRSRIAVARSRLAPREDSRARRRDSLSGAAVAGQRRRAAPVQPFARQRHSPSAARRRGARAPRVGGSPAAAGACGRAACARLTSARPTRGFARARLERDWLDEGRRNDHAAGRARGAARRRSRACRALGGGARARTLRLRSGSPREHATGVARLARRIGVARCAYRSTVPSTRRAGRGTRRSPSSRRSASIDARDVARGRARRSARPALRQVSSSRRQRRRRSRSSGCSKQRGNPSTRCGSPGSPRKRGRRAPRPNPLLPLPWQRERNVPRSTAARELAYATALTAQFARAAPEVVFSYRGERRRSPACVAVVADSGSGDGDGGPRRLARSATARRAPRERAR